MHRIVFLVLLGLLAATGAQSRPRDDVMSGVYRCAAIADSRQWLDCYYGAAQPARAQLGLAPALAAQVRLAASPPAGGVIANGEVRNQVLATASRCYPMADERQWLDCYYGAAQPMRIALGLSPGPAAPVMREAPVQQTSGQQAVAAPAPANLKFTKITSQVQSFSFNRERNFTLTLANGQVWRQVAGDTTYAHWNEPPAHYIATITHGALGSYNLTVKGSPIFFKVRPAASDQ
jgi:hypothetical protein